MLYDGWPVHPNGNVLWDYAAQHKFKVFGTSAKFIEGCQKGGITLATTYYLSELKTILSTGSVLFPEGFDYVYEHVKKDICLASIAGGTYLVACLVGGDPTNAVYCDEIQAPMLGTDTATLLEGGTRAPVGEKCDLCCLKPRPSLPLGFWYDPDGSRYYPAYYDVYPNIWRHGDMATMRRS